MNKLVGLLIKIYFDFDEWTEKTLNDELSLQHINFFYYVVLDITTVTQLHKFQELLKFSDFMNFQLKFFKILDLIFFDTESNYSHRKKQLLFIFQHFLLFIYVHVLLLQYFNLDWTLIELNTEDFSLNAEFFFDDCETYFNLRLWNNKLNGNGFIHVYV